MTVTMMIIIVAGVVIIAFGVLCLISMSKAQKETRNMAKKILDVEKNLGDVSKAVSESVESSKKGDENIIRELTRQAKKQAEIQAEIEAEKKAKAKAEAEAKAKAEKVAAEKAAAEKAAAEKAAAEKAAAEKAAAEKAAAEKAAKAKEAPQAPAKDTEQQNKDTETVSDIDLDEIDINDLLDDFEDILPEIGDEPQAVQHVPENRPAAAMATGTFSEEEIRKPEIIQTESLNQEILIPKAVKPEPEIQTPQIQHVDYDIGKSGKKYTASELEALIRE